MGADSFHGNLHGVQLAPGHIREIGIQESLHLLDVDQPNVAALFSDIESVAPIGDSRTCKTHAKRLDDIDEFICGNNCLHFLSPSMADHMFIPVEWFCFTHVKTITQEKSGLQQQIFKIVNDISMLIVLSVYRIRFMNS